MRPPVVPAVLQGMVMAWRAAPVGFLTVSVASAAAVVIAATADLVI